MLSRKQVKLLACPRCKNKLRLSKNELVCSRCSSRYGFLSGFPVLIPGLTDDVKLSMQKWDSLYRKKLESGEYLKDLYDYQTNHQPKIVRQIERNYKIKREDVYLEIGCGPGYLGLYFGKKGAMVIGIDFSIGALKIARKLARIYNIKNTLFVCGDITQMPFVSNSVNLVYGGGVIEHFRDTKIVISELNRVLKKGGVSFNTVPCLNVGTIYRLRWGNIPNVPVVRQIFEFINLNILRGRHMTFGYELSFLRSTLKNLHKEVGFRKVLIDRFDTYLVLESVPSIIKPLFEYLCQKSELFWPMYKVIGRK